MAAIAAFCLIGVVLSKTLERYAREQAMLAAMAVAVLVTGAVLAAVLPVLAQIASLFDRAGLPAAYVRTISKALGICWLTQLAADVCRDSREEAVATAVTMAGKLALLLLALPLLNTLLDTVGGLLP